jgi:hypothetical protein
MRIANRIFTERPLSQVEVIAHLLGYDMEFTKNNTWTFVNVSTLYWAVFRRWPHLRCASGVRSVNEGADEVVLLEEVGQRIFFIQAYPHRGRVLQRLSLYDYMSVVKLKRKGKVAAVGRGEVEFDSAWPLSQTWVQVLRDFGKDAIVCLDGYLSMDFSEDEESYHRRYVVCTVDSSWRRLILLMVGRLYNILLSSFHGNRFCQRHPVILMPFGRGKSKCCLGGYYVL